ncbi:MAG: hypothetical protein ACYTG6_16770, partial [Planctomycetota bacterium]
LGTVQVENLLDLTMNAEAAGPFMEFALGRTPARSEPLTIYVFQTRDHGEQFVHKVPDLSAEYLEGVLAANLKGFSIGANRYVILGVETADTQLDMGMLTTFDTLFQATFGDGSGREMRGWIYEGLSRYLTFRLTGLRLSVTAGGRYARPATGGTAAVSGGALARADAMYEAGEAPELRLLLGKHLDGFGPGDSVCSYAFASYLVEARPEEVGALLDQLIKEVPFDVAFPEALGESLPETEFRYRVWLAEMTRAE